MMANSPISELHKRILTKNHKFLVDYLKVDQEFLSCFTAQDVLTFSHLDQIKVHQVKDDRNNSFLGILPKRGEWGYKRFIEALFTTSQYEVAQHIDHDHPLVKDYEQAERAKKEAKEGDGVPPMTSNILDPAVVGRVLGLIESGSPLSIVPISQADDQMKRESSYPLENPVHGRAIIVTYGPEPSSAETALLNALFNGLHFSVSLWTTTSSNELVRKLQEEAASIQAQSDTQVVQAVVVYLLNSAGSSLPSTDNIRSYFDGRNCPTLNGKPKLFFIQTIAASKDKELTNNRGEGGVLADGVVGADGGVGPDGRVGAVPPGCDAPNGPASRGSRPARVHEKADQLIVRLHGAERVGGGVSCVTSALAHSLASHAHTCSLLQLLDLVGWVVREFRQKQGGAQTACQEIIQHESLLNKDFYFRP